MSLACVVALIGFTAEVRGQFGLDNPLALRAIPDLQTEVATDFWGRFHVAFDQRLDEVYADRLHPLKVMQWDFLNPGASPSWLRERSERAVTQAGSKSLEYGLRDALAGSAMLNWLETRAEAFGDLLSDSVDAVEEESLSPFDLSYGAVERSWWQNVAERRAVRYGVRPLRADPYAFLSLKLKDEDQLLVLGHVRYYVQDLVNHKFELACSMPVAAGLMLDLGTSYQFGEDADERRFVVKLFKPLRHHGIVHVGVEIRQMPVLFAGITMPL